MTQQDSERTLNGYARIAGATYLVTMLLGIFSVNFVASRLIVPGNALETAHNIRANEVLFRIGMAGEIALYALVVLLALALYVVLRTVDRHLALLALSWRLGEAIIGGGLTVISGLVPLLLITRGPGPDAAPWQELAGVLLGVRGAGLDVVRIFIGLGGTIFCYLFLRSRYVPRILAAWGILTYLSMLVISLVSLLTPDLSEAVKMGFYAPGGAFEMLFGLWLLVKGLNLKGRGPRASNAA